MTRLIVMSRNIILLLTVQCHNCMCEYNFSTYIYFYIPLLHISVVNCLLFGNLNNGMITCALRDDGVPSYQDTCSFTCNTGYELTGSDTRTCQSDGSWSGSNVTCRRGVL